MSSISVRTLLAFFEAHWVESLVHVTRSSSFRSLSSRSGTTSANLMNSQEAGLVSKEIESVYEVPESDL